MSMRKPIAPQPGQYANAVPGISSKYAKQLKLSLPVLYLI